MSRTPPVSRDAPGAGSNSVEIYDAPGRAHDARTAKVLENYATLLRAMNRAEEAERLEARARSIRSDRP